VDPGARRAAAGCQHTGCSERRQAAAKREDP